MVAIRSVRYITFFLINEIYGVKGAYDNTQKREKMRHLPGSDPFLSCFLGVYKLQHSIVHHYKLASLCQFPDINLTFTTLRFNFKRIFYSLNFDEMLFFPLQTIH